MGLCVIDHMCDHECSILYMPTSLCQKIPCATRAFWMKNWCSSISILMCASNVVVHREETSLELGNIMVLLGYELSRSQGCLVG